MKKYYQMAMALIVAAASLTSCSRSTYSFNTAAPAYLGVQPVKSVAKAEAVPVAVAPVAEAAATENTTPVAVPVAKAASVAKHGLGKKLALAKVALDAKQQSLLAQATAPAEATNVAPAAKPSLMQRLALKQVTKQIVKLQQKQTTAGTQHTASKVGRALLIALAGLLLAIIGIVIAGGSIYGGSGAGVVIGVILYYIGVIAFLVGIILAVIALINGN